MGHLERRWVLLPEDPEWAPWAVPTSRDFGVVVEVLQQCSCGCCGWDGPSSIPARRGAGPSLAVPQ